MLKKIGKFLTSRMAIVGSAILLQAVILVLTIWQLSEYYVYLYAGFSLLSLIAVLFVLNRDDNPSYKLAWAIPIMLFPVFGGLFYLFFGAQRTTKRFRQELLEASVRTRPYLTADPQAKEHLAQTSRSRYNQSHYITRYSGFPLYEHTSTKYLTPGEEKFQCLVEELKKAEHFIFLEYFIIEEGIMWNTILDILVEKVKAGVDVRLIYDDVGCLQTLPYKYNEKMESLGIRCEVFNPFKPALKAIINNRDHRKIAVIDGHTAFTGGINLADEYINAYPKHGHWKDASILIKGEAVWSFTIMFLQVWSVLRKEDASEDYEQFRPHRYHEAPFEGDGFVQPYGDCPLDNESVGENVYLNIIAKARNYVYIHTPYLIVDNELVTALKLAAKSGVDVRIVTPHIPDKWYVHLMTRSYYGPLVESGVKIYEYTPGFIHSKIFVSDDDTATVGTINMDYRSLYLHFECGLWMCRNSSVGEVKADFLKTLENCQQITLEDCRNVKWYVRFMQALFRVFAPLM